MAPRSILDVALSYLERGWWVFPAFVVWDEAAGKKVASFPKSWDAASTNDAGMVTAWFGPGGLYADKGVLCIDCGRSGLVAIDIDGPAGMANWERIRGQAGKDIPETYRVRTPSGSEHWLYQARPGEPVGIDNNGKLAPSVDVRGTGGLIFAPPSHIEGYGSYRWIEGEPMGGSADCPFVPRTVITAMTPKRDAFGGGRPGLGSGVVAGGEIVPGLVDPPRYFTPDQAWAFVSAPLAAFAAIPRGLDGQGRNQRLFELALTFAHFIGEYISAEQAHAMIWDAVRANGMQQTHTEHSIEATIRSAWERGTWRALQPPDLSDASFPAPEAVSGQAAGDGLALALDAVAMLRAEFLGSADLDSLPDPVPLVAGWLWRDTCGALIGPSGHGKTFVSLELSAAVGTGGHWHGIPVEQADVWILVGEGLAGIRKRVRAWEKHHGQAMAGVRLLPRPVQASDTAAWAVLVELARQDRPGLIWLDTQARHTVGMQENDNTEMGIWVHRMNQLRLASGACVQTVHHTGHSGERGRGASSLYGAWDTELSVSKADAAAGGGQVVTVKVSKSKDDGIPEPLELTMTVVDLGYVDRLGKPVTSVVLTQPGLAGGIPGLADPVRKVGRWDRMLAALPESRLKIIDVFQNVFPAAGATKAQAWEQCKGLGITERRTFYRSWDDLIERGVLIRYEGTQQYNLASTFGGETPGQSDL